MSDLVSEITLEAVKAKRLLVRSEMPTPKRLKIGREVNEVFQYIIDTSVNDLTGVSKGSSVLLESEVIDIFSSSFSGDSSAWKDMLTLSVIIIPDVDGYNSKTSLNRYLDLFLEARVSDPLITVLMTDLSEKEIEKFYSKKSYEYITHSYITIGV